MKTRSLNKTITLLSFLAAVGAASTARAEGDVPPVPDGCLHPSWCPEPSTDWDRNLLATDLSLDIAALQGTAVIAMMPSLSSTGMSLDVSGLTVASVTGPFGALQYRVEDGRLDIGVPLGTVFVVVEYGFTARDDGAGWLASGVSFLWPTACGNLYPCKPNPDDGLSFTMEVTGVPDGQVAVYPTEIPWTAPSYMPALAVGDYVKRELGRTPAGTTVSVWYQPGEEEAADAGAGRLVDAFAFFEQTLGPYVFGAEVGTVSTTSSVSYSGMEHHPFWHVASWALDDETTNFHEAAHGWFGNGVRIRCWEDFVLSEGSATYWAQRAVEAVHGAEAAAPRWTSYEQHVAFIDDLYERYVGQRPTVWPTGCNAIDIQGHIAGSGITYYKGALFLREVEQRVGRAAFDQAMSLFYLWHLGRAASMQDLIDTVEWLTGATLDDLVEARLRPAPAVAED